MTDGQSKSLDFAQETTKQLLTLATAVLGVTLTFRKDIVTDVNAGTQHWLEAAWIAYVVSAVLGVLTLGALADEAGQPNASIWAKAVRIPAILQSLVFAAAVILTVVFAVKAL